MDEAGAPFWFNGQPRKVISNLIAYPAGNGVADGKQFIASGLQPLQPNKKGWTVSFPKAGNFTFFCDIHKGMKMTVTVKKAGAKIPAAAADKKQADKELKADLAIAKTLLASPGPTTNVVMMGNDKGKVATFDFFPKVKNVHVGDTVSFEMTKGTSEEHTVTFGPPAYLGPIETILPDAATGTPPKLAVDSRLYYASDPGAVLTYNGTNHGNGFLNTGALDGDDGGPVGRVRQVTFTAPGSFQYLCLLHPQMVGTIVVS
jgi:plastocyanin